MTDRTVEEEFFILLGKLTYYYSHLEVEVGLCLRFVVNPQNPSSVNPLIAGRSMADKLNQLKQVVVLNYAEEDPEFIKKLNSWVNAMDSFRVKRNNYMHGLWEVCPLPNIEDPIEFNRVHWKAGGNGQPSTYDETQYMRLDELKVVIREVEELRKEFSSLYHALRQVMTDHARKQIKK